MSNWIERWNDTIAAEPEMPGVWRRKDGGFRVRGRTKDPKTGERRGVNRALPDCKRAREAASILETELEQIRLGHGTDPDAPRPRFAEWCAEVFARKVASGAITAASGRKNWASHLGTHLIPAFGPIYIDKLTREDVERWKHALLTPRELGKDGTRKRRLKGGKYSPETINTILGVLRQITAAASDAFNIADPCRTIENISKRGHRTYTYEDPNALKPDDVPRFLELARVSYPEHYAFVMLGFTTGLRPSSLRPLRRSGGGSDVKWGTGELLVRRSHTHGSEVMDATKTDQDQLIALDSRQLDTLRWHCERLDRDNERRTKRSPHLGQTMATSELLFPAPPNGRNRGGGFRSQSCLDKMFADIGERLALGYEVTPRCMRRTYQDLCRAANVADIVTRSISGHATAEMQRHYSTVSGDEQRAGLARVFDIATGTERKAA